MNDPVRLTNPQDMLASLPYLVKQIPPAPGLVALVMSGGTLKGTGCTSLHDAHITPKEYASSLAEFVRENKYDALMLVGLGTDTEIIPYLEMAVNSAREYGISVPEALRAHQGRYWSLVCQYTTCCPPEGTPIDPDRSAAPAELTVRGVVPAPDPVRCHKALAPYQVSTTAVYEAVTAAQERIEHVTQQGNSRLLEYGQEVITQAVGAQIAGHGPTTITELVNLAVLLRTLQVRDSAWYLIHEDVQAHQELWTKVTRAAVGVDRAAPAALTAVASWYQKDTTMAHAAVEEALRADPHYSLALLIQKALKKNMPAEPWIETVAKWKGPQQD